jgi:hypothetical protein
VHECGILMRKECSQKVTVSSECDKSDRMMNDVVSILGRMENVIKLARANMYLTNCVFLSNETAQVRRQVRM